jgi:hypothetical protein
MLRRLSVVCVVLWAVAPGLAAQTVCDHPADSIDPQSEARRLHALFDAPRERRIFSETHYYPRTATTSGDPHLTVGMGHWTYGNLIELFRRLRASPTVWSEVVRQWHRALDSDMWIDFAADTAVAGRSEESLDRGLKHLLCVNGEGSCEERIFRPWSHKRAAQFNQATNWFRAGWLAVSRLQAVAEVQVQWWLDSVVLPAESAAKQAGVTSLGAVASLASARSTSSGYVRRLTGKIDAVKEVPAAARPRSGPVDENRLLSDWKAVVAWSEYNRIKNDIRPRMRAIWRAYFEPSWGPLPKAVGDLSSIKHTGCYMAVRPIERTVQLLVSSSQSCSAGAPRFTPAECSK